MKGRSRSMAPGKRLAIDQCDKKPGQGVWQAGLPFPRNFLGDGAIERADEEIDVFAYLTGAYPRGNALAAVFNRAADDLNLGAQSADTADLSRFRQHEQRLDAVHACELDDAKEEAGRNIG